MNRKPGTAYRWVSWQKDRLGVKRKVRKTPRERTDKKGF